MNFLKQIFVGVILITPFLMAIAQCPYNCEKCLTIFNNMDNSLNTNDSIIHKNGSNACAYKPILCNIT